MRVKELIEALKKEDGEKHIIIRLGGKQLIAMPLCVNCDAPLSKPLGIFRDKITVIDAELEM